MKTKYILLLTLLLSQTTPIWSDPGEEDNDIASTNGTSMAKTKSTLNSQQASQTKTKVTLSDLRKAIDDAKRETQQRLAHQNDTLEKVIVIGNSGNGKSALIHALAKTAVVKDIDGEFKIQALTPNPLPEIIIGSGLGQHGTSVPGAWYDEEHKAVFWDCPGLEDPGVHGEDITNGEAVRELFTAGTKARVLLAIDEGVLFESQPIALQHLFNAVTTAFPNIDQLKQSLCLVVTKHFPNRNPLSKLTTLKDRGNLQILTDSGRDLFNFLVDASLQRVSLLPAPMDGEGPYGFKQREVFKAIFESTKPTLNPIVKSYLNATSQLLVQDLAKEINDAAVNFLKTQVSQKIIAYCHNEIDKHKTSIGDLRENLQKVIKTLKTLATVKENNIEEFANKLDPYVKRTAGFISPLRQIIEDLKFLKDIFSEVNFALNDWRNALKDLKKYLKSLVQVPDTKVENNVLYVKGTLVGTSDVKAAIGRHKKSPFDVISTSASQTLFLDGNITRHGAFCSFEAPQWKVVIPTTIDLSGLDNTTKASSGTSYGAHGNPGAPGNHGGFFYGVGTTYSSLKDLTIDTSGGKGGDGGNGYVGAPGSNGIAGNENWLRSLQGVTTKSSQAYRGHPTRDFEIGFIIPLLGQTHWIPQSGAFAVHGHLNGTETVYSVGENNATPGKDGGRGGAGGMGGYPGLSIIENARSWNTILKPGNPGKNGAAGAGGLGGLNGPVIEGTYLSGLNGTYDHHTSNMWGKHCNILNCRQSNDWLSIRRMSEQYHAPSGNSGLGFNRIGQQTPKSYLITRIVNIKNPTLVLKFKKFFPDEEGEPKTNEVVDIIL